jgi:hypothetical protein
MLILFIIIIFKQNKTENTTNKMFSILDYNIDNINKIHRLNVVKRLKSNLDIYSKYQIIQKVSKANYVSLLRCDYSNRSIDLDVIFTIDQHSNIYKKFFLDNIKINAKFLTNDIINNNYEIKKLDFNSLNNETFVSLIRKSNINNIYYKNIYNEQGILEYVTLFLYKDNDLLNNDIVEIDRILKEAEKGILEIDKSSDDDIKSIVKNKRDKKIKNYSFIKKLFVFITTSLILFFIFSSIRIDSEKIFNYYFEPSQIYHVARGGEQESDIRDIYVKFNNKNFKETTILFDEYFNEYGYNDYDVFYAGLSALFNDEPDKALELFNKMSKDTIYNESVEWFISGCYLLKGDVESAKEILNKIANESVHDYKESAIKILKYKIK